MVGIAEDKYNAAAERFENAKPGTYEYSVARRKESEAYDRLVRAREAAGLDKHGRPVV